jgi:hypothetical protein
MIAERPCNRRQARGQAPPYRLGVFTLEERVAAAYRRLEQGSTCLLWIFLILRDQAPEQLAGSSLHSRRLAPFER